MPLYSMATSALADQQLAGLVAPGGRRELQQFGDYGEGSAMSTLLFATFLFLAIRRLRRMDVP